MIPEPLGDEVLSAWVDGELAAAERARVQAWLDSHPEDAARAAAWAADRAALQQLFANGASEPLPAALRASVWRRRLPRWLTRRLEVPVKLFNLQALGFELVGGRLLPAGPGKSAQLMYQDAQGLRVTVYLRKPEQAADAAFRYERQGELGLFYWVEEGCGYALVGALPRQTLLALAEAIYKQHPAARSAPGG